MRRFAFRALVLLAALVGAQDVTGAGQSAAGAVPPAAGTATTPDESFTATGQFHVTHIEWAGPNPTDTSTFGGRCSAPSSYVISFAAQVEAVPLGRVTGEFSHCSQLKFGPSGPAGASYSDGRGKYVAADGDELHATYGEGVSGANAETGKLWWRDKYTFTGGTGRFAGASGTGRDFGEFASFDEVLAGASVPFNAEGTLKYEPRR